MAGWREHKRKSLGDIHRTFEIPAVYLVSSTHEPVRVNVRLHQRHAVSEQVLAEWGNAASLLDMTDRIIFSDKEVPNVMNRAYVIFGSDEAYKTGPSRPKREGYTGVEVVNVEKSELVTLLSKLDTTHPAYKGILV